MEGGSERAREGARERGGSEINPENEEGSDE
jgi:hypothetical protein